MYFNEVYQNVCEPYHVQKSKAYLICNETVDLNANSTKEYIFVEKNILLVLVWAYIMLLAFRYAVLFNLV